MEALGPRVRVRAAKPLEGWRALISVENGVQREVDLEPYLHGLVFEPVRNDPAMFRSMRIEGGTVAWENGADTDPDVLYYNLKPAWMDDAEASGTQGSCRRGGLRSDS